MKKAYQITEDGRKELEEELAALKGRRGEIAEKIAEARGLLDERPPLEAAARIIPARAGFTGCRPGRGPGTWDHPRSRGVYPCSRTKSRIRSGSSPLARGLPLEDGGDDPAAGIIPARAGFTVRAPGLPVGGGDHPRSRGVYEILLRPARPLPGSSPLARGLRRAHGPPLGG